MKPEDPYSLFTALAATVFSSQLAQIFGPYMLILVMSTAGSMAALGRREPDKKPGGITFILVVNIIAVGLTSVLSNSLANYLPDSWDLDYRTLFAPVALGIGFIGLDWPEVLPWLWEKWSTWRTSGGKSA